MVLPPCINGATAWCNINDNNDKRPVVYLLMHEASPTFAVLSPVAQAAGLSNVARSICLPDRLRHPVMTNREEENKSGQRGVQPSLVNNSSSPLTRKQHAM